MRFKEDPARVTKGMDEFNFRDDLIAALVDNNDRKEENDTWKTRR